MHQVLRLKNFGQENNQLYFEPNCLPIINYFPLRAQTVLFYSLVIAPVKYDADGSQFYL